MGGQAKISSLEALEAFRSQLILYVAKARPALEEVTADTQRLRSWLENDQRLLWEGHMRRRAKDLEQAKAELFSARLGNLREETSAELMAVTRARRACEEADAKLRTIKHWDREFDSRVQPLLKQTEKLHTVLSHDLTNAIATLTQHINALAAYLQVQTPQGDVPSASSGPENSAKAEEAKE